MGAVEVALEIEAMSHLQAIQAAVANLGMMKLENKSDFQNLKSSALLQSPPESIKKR